MNHQNQRNDYNNQDAYNTYSYYGYPEKPRKNTNTPLLVAISVLTSLIVVLVVAGILIWGGVLSFGSDKTDENQNAITSTEADDADVVADKKTEQKPIPVNKTMYADCKISITLRESPSTNATEICQIPNGHAVFVMEYTNDSFAKVNYNGRDGYVLRSYLSSEKKTITVEKTMYVNCNVSLTLRTGPATSYSEIHSIPVGEPVYVYEYSNSEFAKVNHNGQDGFVMRKYLSDTQPAVWNYNAADVETFVENSVYAFVSGVNNHNTDYVYNYFSGSLQAEEARSCSSIDSRVISEEVLSLNCHSTTRTSPMRVTVIRDSNIRVEYNDGTIKDIVEKYKYTVDYSSGQMYIVAMESIK